MMKRMRVTLTGRLVMVAIACGVVGTPSSAVSRGKTLASLVPTSNVASTLDCEGNACGQVTLTWEEEKQQYKTQNNSDRIIKVEAANLAASASVNVAPGKTDYLALKSIVGPYHANYEAARPVP